MVTVHRATAVRRDGWGGHCTPRRLVITDVLALVWVVFGVQIAWFGFDSRSVTGSPRRPGARVHDRVDRPDRTWLLMLALYDDTRDPRYDVDGGAGEYRRIVDSAIRLFALVAIIAYAFKLEIARATSSSRSRSASCCSCSPGGCGGSGSTRSVAGAGSRARRPGGLHHLGRAHRP